MLTPETRVLLTDALRPPAGYRVEVAVGTTYSLNLTALLLAPLSFALFDQGNADEIGVVDPIRLLEAVRRYADRTTVFCQAGGIHVPSNYRSILTFVEDSVLEAMPSREGAIFHQKVWAIRFIDQGNNRIHRVIILSRNMTFDRSWDTALVLDEEGDGAIDAAPAADFVRRLPTLALRPPSAGRAAKIEELASSLSVVRLAAPSPFTTGELLPIGMTDDRVWPFPDQGRRLLAISPFLAKSAISAISGIAADRIVVSRAESLELVGSKVLEGWSVNVLQRLAEVDPGTDLDDISTPAPNGFLESNDGLHAKTFVIDVAGGRSTIVTGSANLTSAAWGTNVEFDAVLTGPTSACGVEAVLNGSPEAPGLGRILEEYSITDEEVGTDAAVETSYVLEQFHQQLAANEPELHITSVGDDRVTATLTLTIPSDAPGETKLWLASLSGEVHSQPLAPTLTWTIAPINITPFIAFALTLESHLQSEDQNHHPERVGATSAAREDLGWMDEVLDWDAEPADDDPGSDDERTTFGRIAALPGIVEDVMVSGGSVMEAAYRRQLAEWAERHAEPADSKAIALVDELNAICRPAGDWDNGERVIVFTEYKATQQWLAGILTARGLGGDRLGLLFGGMDDNKREHLKAAFQADPNRDPIRILLATDAASEGIDLQRHCCRVIHYDIPFNPNRLEQRIGRVDRHGQTHEVEVSHFIGAGWEREPEGSYVGDLEYLSRVAQKVATERQDLGSVNPVLAHAVEARMLGRPVLIDPLQVTPKASTSLLRAERDLREQVRRLHDQLDASVRTLHVASANVRRVVETALKLADQPPLATGGDGLIAPPALRAGWERTITGLADPLDGHLRPLTFDAKAAENRDDVVLAHLEYPLVAQATRLLRSAIWGGRAALNRVAAVRFAPPSEAGVNGPLVAVFARLVLVGADGRRLHEEIILSGRIVPPTGRSRRVELEENRHEALHSSVEEALEPDACRLAPESARLDFASRWSELEPLLANDVQLRAKERKQRLQRELDQNEAKETRDVEAVFTQLKANLDTALDVPGAVQLTLDQLDELEQKQFERDRDAWKARRDGLEEEKQRELDAIRQRYANVRELVFPFAIALCVPDGGDQ